MNIAILDDYANAALTLADWSAVSAQSRIQVFTTHLPDDEISAVLQPFDIVCTVRERTTFSRPLIESLPALKLIVVTDQRVTTIDYAAAKERGVLVCIGKPPLDLVGKPSGSAEFAWALIMATVRHIPIESERLRQGGWQHTLGLTLAGCTLGLVGLGNIGSRIARYARAFDMNVLAWSQNLTDETANQAGAKRVDKDALFRMSDIVSIHYVLGTRSVGLVGASEIAAMKPTAYLINTSRGPIVKEEALIAALQAKRIAGAGLDVFDREPLPQGHPFFALDNVTLTPHLGFVTEEAMRGFFAGAALAVAAYLRGHPINIFDSEGPASH